MAEYDPTKYVLIDPDDKAAIGMIFSCGNRASLAAYLKSLLQAEEPTGLGAVVRDGEGAIRTRDKDGDFYRVSPTPIEPKRQTFLKWTDLPQPVMIMFEGIKEDS